MSELLPCPFCGGKAVFHDCLRPPETYPCRVYCDNCWAEVGGYSTEAEAIAAWNSRAERTCHIEHVKGGAMYDVWRCSTCGYEYAESVSEMSIAQNYCPYCGCKVVGE